MQQRCVGHRPRPDDCSIKVGFHVCAKVVLRTGGKYDEMGGGGGGWQFLLMVKPYCLHNIYIMYGKKVGCENIDLRALISNLGVKCRG